MAKRRKIKRSIRRKGRTVTTTTSTRVVKRVRINPKLLKRSITETEHRVGDTVVEIVRGRNSAATAFILVTARGPGGVKTWEAKSQGASSGGYNKPVQAASRVMHVISGEWGSESSENLEAIARAAAKALSQRSNPKRRGGVRRWRVARTDPIVRTSKGWQVALVRDGVAARGEPSLVRKLTRAYPSENAAWSAFMDMRSNPGDLKETARGWLDKRQPNGLRIGTAAFAARWPKEARRRWLLSVRKHISAAQYKTLRQNIASFMLGRHPSKAGRGARLSRWNPGDPRTAITQRLPMIKVMIPAGSGKDPRNAETRRLKIVRIAARSNPVCALRLSKSTWKRLAKADRRSLKSRRYVRCKTSKRSATRWVRAVVR